VNRSWRVSVEVARDDHAALTDEALGKLTAALADDRTTVDPQASGAVLVRMTVEGTSEWAARSSAEDTLRAAANRVWAELGLPPFTVTFVEVAPETGG
jgi:hypothetical protein